MNHINPNKVGSTLGAVVGGIHVVWSVFVLFGWAQGLVDFIFTIHMVKPIFVVQPFGLMHAIALVAITALVGYGVGYLFAHTWNHFHR